MTKVQNELFGTISTHAIPHNQIQPPGASQSQPLEPDADKNQSSLLNEHETMFTKAIEFVERRMEKEDEKYARLLAAHEKVIDFLISEKLGGHRESPKQKVS